MLFKKSRILIWQGVSTAPTSMPSEDLSKRRISRWLPEPHLAQRPFYRWSWSFGIRSSFNVLTLNIPPHIRSPRCYTPRRPCFRAFTQGLWERIKGRCGPSWEPLPNGQSTLSPEMRMYPPSNRKQNALIKYKGFSIPIQRNPMMPFRSRRPSRFQRYCWTSTWVSARFVIPTIYGRIASKRGD